MGNLSFLWGPCNSSILQTSPRTPSPLFFLPEYLLLCFVSSVSPVAGAVRRPWPPLCRPPPSTSCSSPTHASSSPRAGSVFCPVVLLQARHDSPERPPAAISPPPQFPHGLALSLPLFCSVASATSTRFVCTASLLAKPTPSSLRLHRPTPSSGELRVTVGSHVQAAIALTDPSRSSPGTCLYFPAPGRLPTPAKEPSRPTPPAAASCPPWAGHLGHLHTTKTLRPDSL
jgi:hypothetical protein